MASGQRKKISNCISSNNLPDAWQCQVVGDFFIRIFQFAFLRHICYIKKPSKMGVTLINNYCFGSLLKKRGGMI